MACLDQPNGLQLELQRVPRAVLRFASCGSTNVTGGSSPRFYVLVPPSQTLHLTYPTALVFGAIGGQSCIAFQGGDNMDISVNGYIN